MNWPYLMPVLRWLQGLAEHCSSDCARRQIWLHPGNETLHCPLSAIIINTGVDQIKDLGYFTEIKKKKNQTKEML